MNNNISLTKRTHHINIQYFTIHDYREDGDIITKHNPDIINHLDDLTHPLGYSVHSYHFCCIIGHYN